MKNWLKNYWLLIVIVALPIVALCVFIPLLACCGSLSDWISLAVGVLAYAGTAFLGYMAYRQNKKLNNLNNEYQRRLTQTQISHSFYVEASNSIIEAIASFDLHKIEHLALDYRPANIDKYLDEIAELRSCMRNAQTQLGIRTDYNVEKIDCDKSTQTYRDYKKASEDFRDCYNDVFTRFFSITGALREFLKDIHNNKITKEMERVYDETISLVHDEKLRSALEQEKKEKIKGKLSKDDIESMLTSIVDALLQASTKYIDDLSLSSKVYLAALQSRLAEMGECGTVSCKKVKAAREEARKKEAE